MIVPETNISFEDTKKVLSYDEMMEICNNTDNFDYIDENIYGRNIRVFNYRLDIFKSFAQKGGRNFRGTVYDKDSKELLALPFFKFFNYNQSAFTLSNIVDNWKIKCIYEKVDGSLVYFYKVNNILVCRTKRSYTNLQSIRSMEIVNNDIKLKDFILNLIDKGYTPMFEFLSPINRLVVKYKFETLCYLGSRNRITGDMIFPNDNHKELLDIDIWSNPNISTYPIIEKLKTIDDVVNECSRGRIINNIFMKLKTFTKYKFINKIVTYYSNKTRDKIREGYCIVFDNGEIIKIKRLSYLSIFRIRNNITSDKEIAINLFNNTLDDIISEFKDDTKVIDYINMIIECIDDTWNKSINISKEFYNNNKDMNRKDYAIKARNKLDSQSFSISMEYYKNHDTNIELEKVKESYINYKRWRKSKLYKKECIINEEV